MTERANASQRRPDDSHNSSPLVGTNAKGRVRRELFDLVADVNWSSVLIGTETPGRSEFMLTTTTPEIQASRNGPDCKPPP